MLLLQASDRDSSNNDNNVITYSIIAGPGVGQWQIDPATGRITAKAPVDYEKIPNKLGL